MGKKSSSKFTCKPDIDPKKTEGETDSNKKEEK